MTTNLSRIRRAAVLAAALSFACGAPPEEDSSAAGSSPASALRTTALSDQFNAYDSSTWEMANWANGNPFNCGFLPDHVTFSSGSMRLRLDNVPSSGKQYSGGEYRTRDTFSYGRFETRMIAAKGSGLVTSFFTYTGSPWDEIDVEILGKNTTQAQFNYFVNGVGGHERIVDLGFDASAGYHTYAFEWEPNAIRWYVDGVLKHTATGSPTTLPSHPMQIMMNLWNGIGVDSWLGPFTYAGPYTATYDYASYAPPGSSSFALTVSKTGSGSGTVTSNPSGINCGGTCSANYSSGTNVTLSASPTSPSTFGGWSGACSGTGTCIVSMTAARSVTATFNGTSSYALTVAKSGSGSGTVTSNPSGINCGSTCSASYSSGTAVTLSASPASGSTFGGWSGACTGTGSCIVTMTTARSVTATFNGQQQGGPVSINAGGGATGTFVADVNFSGGNTSSTSNAIDTSLVSGTVPPQAVFQTERWGDSTYTIPGLTAGSPYSVTLYFAEIYWTAAGRRTFNVAVNGATVLSAFDVFVAAGGARKGIARSFNTTANGNGQVVIQFTRSGGVDNPTIAGIVIADGSVGTGYTLSVNKAGTGSGTVAGGAINCGSTCTAANLASGTSVTLTATPASGSTFVGWSGACTGSGSCVASMTADRTVTATFNTTGGTGFTLSVNKAGTGTGTVAGGPINCGSTCAVADLPSSTTVTLTATPASGSTFVGWSGACSGTGSCVTSMTSDRTVTATFNTSGTGSCTTATGGQSGNFNTTGAVCYTVNTNINGWGCSNAAGRTVTVNGTSVTCGQPLPGSAPYTFSFSAGTYPWASFYWW